MSALKQIIKSIIPSRFHKAYMRYRFDESQIIYKGINYRDFLTAALTDFKKEYKDREIKSLLSDIKDTYIADGTRPDEYFLYGFEHKRAEERSVYMPQRAKDKILLNFYSPKGLEIIEQLRDKWIFYNIAKPFFKRDVVKIESVGDFADFEVFSMKHKHFICKIINSGCGVGIRKETVDDKEHSHAKVELFNKLIGQGKWIIEELIIQHKTLSYFNESSVNTVRFPSFRHGNNIVQAYPCIRFGRKGSIVDNAGQKGVFASIDIKTGTICTNGFDELGNEYEMHPDSKVHFKGFTIPQWSELIEVARQAHLSLPENQTYVAFDFALSDKGWMIVEGNWGDFVLQQTSLKRGLKNEFLSLLNG